MMKNRLIHESQHAVSELEISATIESYLNQSFINTQYYLDASSSQALVNDYQDSLITAGNTKRNVRIALQGLNLNLKKIDQLSPSQKGHGYLSPSVQKSYQQTKTELKKRIATYNSLIEQLLNYRSDHFLQAKKLLNVTVEPFYNKKLIPLVQKFRNQIQKNQKSGIARLNHKFYTYGNALFIAFFLAFVLSLLIEYLLYKSITNQVDRLAKTADEIGRGNLDERFEVQTDDEIGQLGESLNRMAQNLNRITFSKEYVDDILSSMRDALIVTDIKGVITKVNSATLNLLDYDEEELTGQSMSSILVDDNNEKLFSTEDGSSIENYETLYQTKNGERVPMSVSKSAIHHKGGLVQGSVFVASDITERKKSERVIKESLREKEVLLSEIHHRVKNNLAVISGLLQMQRWETDQQAARDVLQDSQLRVKSIALVHEKLYQTENLSDIAFDKYIKDLIESINKAFIDSEKQIVFNLDIEPIKFSINQAITCSLLLNELVVNVHKHAFKHQSEGHVDITLKKKDELLTLIVKDNGQGLPKEDKESKSLGMSLIHTLVEQLNGEMKSYNDDGAVFEINFKREEV